MKREFTGSGESASIDRILVALGDEHRRAVIRALNDAEAEPMGIDTLAELVAKRVQCGTLSAAEHRDRVRLTLHHTHLPKLATCGLILYDTDTQRIQNTTSELERDLLAVLDSHEQDG